MDENDLYPACVRPNDWLKRIQPRLNEAWSGFWKAGTVEPGRYLCDHELVLISRGSCRIQVEEESHDLAAGSFLIVPPGRRHVTIAGPNGVRRDCFHFDWENTGVRVRAGRIWVFHPRRPRVSWIKNSPRFVPRRILAGGFDLEGPVLPLAEAVNRRWSLRDDLERRAASLALHELLLRLNWKAQSRAAPPARSASLAYAIKHLLDQTAGDAGSIQEMLPTLGFSYAHLCRLFRVTFGISPVRYRNAARLERARRVLHDPRRTVADAALAAGFADPAYFSRAYRRAYGQAPSRNR